MPVMPKWESVRMHPDHAGSPVLGLQFRYSEKGKSLQLYSGTFVPVEANQRFRRSAFANP